MGCFRFLVSCRCLRATLVRFAFVIYTCNAIQTSVWQVKVDVSRLPSNLTFFTRELFAYEAELMVLIILGCRKVQLSVDF